jgi:hypothetical protein
MLFHRPHAVGVSIAKCSIAAFVGLSLSLPLSSHMAQQITFVVVDAKGKTPKSRVAKSHAALVSRRAALKQQKASNWSVSLVSRQRHETAVRAIRRIAVEKKKCTHTSLKSVPEKYSSPPFNNSSPSSPSSPDWRDDNSSTHSSRSSSSEPDDEAEKLIAYQAPFSIFDSAYGSSLTPRKHDRKPLHFSRSSQACSPRKRSASDSP